MERRERDREEVCLLAFFVFSLFCRFCRCVFWLVSYFHYFAALLTSKLFHSFLQRGEREAHAGSYNRAREASNAAARRCLFVSNCVGPRNQKRFFVRLSLLSLLFLLSSFIKKNVRPSSSLSRALGVLSVELSFFSLALSRSPRRVRLSPWSRLARGAPAGGRPRRRAFCGGDRTRTPTM